MPDSLGPADAHDRPEPQPASTPLWWARHHLTDEHRLYTDYEAVAATISIYQPLVVPGLMQTRAYATAVSTAILAGQSAADIEALVTTRLRRQQVIEERLAAGAEVRLVIIVDEIVLRRVVGDAATMGEQLEQLAVQAGREHVELIVLPTALGAHAGLGGVFELLEFTPDEAVAFLESATGDRLLHYPPDTSFYRRCVADLRAVGTRGTEAVALVREIREQLTG